MAVTLRDVAQHAGVSARTISNVVNGFPHVSPAMRAKVEAALGELNYKPNLLARSLRQGRTGIITLLLPDIAVSYFDNVQAAREAVRHLIDSGRRPIAAIGGSASTWDVTSRLRLKGYRQELRAVGLPADGWHARTPDYKRASAAVAVRSLLSGPDPPDGLFCFSDELAAGVLRELYERGLRAPSDISVVGFDDIQEARFATPSLTSIRPDKAKIAEVAVDMLIQRIQGSEAKPRDVRIGYELVVRESSALSPRRASFGTRLDTRVGH